MCCVMPAAPQDPVDAGYTQLLCGSSDEDNNEDATTDGAERALGAHNLEASVTAADRLLHMLETDYLRCLEAERSAPVEPSSLAGTADRKASRDARSGLHESEPSPVTPGHDHAVKAYYDGTCALPQDDTGGGVGLDQADSDTVGGAGGGGAGGDGAGGIHAEASMASAASADADDDAAVCSASISSVASDAQGGAFAQAVADSPVGDIKAAMAGITLPPAAWPSWARDVSETELLERLRTNAK